MLPSLSPYLTGCSFLSLLNSSSLNAPMLACPRAQAGSSTLTMISFHLMAFRITYVAQVYLFRLQVSLQRHTLIPLPAQYLRFLRATSNLTCPKLNSSSPLKPYLSAVSSPQLTDLYPSGCSGKSLAFLHSYSFLSSLMPLKLSVPKIFRPTGLPPINSKLKGQLHQQ